MYSIPKHLLGLNHKYLAAHLKVSVVTLQTLSATKYTCLEVMMVVENHSRRLSQAMTYMFSILTLCGGAILLKTRKHQLVDKDTLLV